MTHTHTHTHIHTHTHTRKISWEHQPSEWLQPGGCDGRIYCETCRAPRFSHPPHGVTDMINTPRLSMFSSLFHTNWKEKGQSWTKLWPHRYELRTTDWCDTVSWACSCHVLFPVNIKMWWWYCRRERDSTSKKSSKLSRWFRNLRTMGYRGHC